MLGDKLDCYIAGELIAVQDETSDAYKSLLVGVRQYAYPVRVSVKTENTAGLLVGSQITVAAIVTLRESGPNSRQPGTPYFAIYGTSVSQTAAAAA